MGFRSFATGTDETKEGRETNREESKAKRTTCLFCTATHDIDDCDKFLCLPLTERRNFVQAKRVLGVPKVGPCKQRLSWKESLQDLQRTPPRPFLIMLAFFRHFLGKRAFFSFFLEKELLAFSVIFHDCEPDFST